MSNEKNMTENGTQTEAKVEAVPEMMQLKDTGVGSATAEMMTISDAGIGAASATTMNIQNAGVGAAAAQQMTVKDSSIMMAAANTIEGENVSVLFTPQAAIAFGLAVSVGLFLLRKLFGKK